MALERDSRKAPEVDEEQVKDMHAKIGQWRYRPRVGSYHAADHRNVAAAAIRRR